VIVTETALPGVYTLEIEPHADERGFFARVWDGGVLAAAGLDARVSQSSIAYNHRAGTLRGLHFQIAPAAQGKLVLVLSGEVFDVVVDLRNGATFGRWASVKLSGSEPTMLWVPEGFAHGFQTVAPDTAVTYKTTAEYSPTHERGILWSDPQLAIPWPIADPVLSDRDRTWPPLARESLSR